jgi:methylglyoxal synthase
MVTKSKMSSQKRIAVIAHDARKPDLLEWIQFNKATLRNHDLFGTGSTGTLIQKETGLRVHLFKSGPLGGDQQIGAKIADGDLDFLIFFWDPLEPQPHDPDVKALLRLAVLYNLPTASNRATADFLISSQFMNQPYERLVPDYLHLLKKISEEDEY